MPAQTPNKVNSYKNDNNTKGDTQKDTVWGSVQKMYLNYFKDLESHSKTKIDLLKPIKDHNKAQIDLP